jgi:cyclopropane fatty-acyl-phospholipid synthase-like methyltransferase
MAKVGKDDVVYDLGCGDGRMVTMAVKNFGAKRGVGIDLDPEMVKQCKENAKKHGVADKVEFRVGDVLKVEDLSEANVVLLYMGDDINQRLKPILQKTLKPGSRVVSHRFLMGDDWPPDRSEHAKATMGEDAGYEHDIHLWTIKGTKKKK